MASARGEQRAGDPGRTRRTEAEEHGRMTTLAAISDIRERTGLSQSQFSALLGVWIRTPEWERDGAHRRAPLGRC
jgi:DNA-binding transcriptional regulator YiaG